uniref:(California timema) hypothetical protein n=1 Tax=Timema californicum TaxID=61474 RepID=A0A7R9IWR5_TIMCA|nr:unnamed protein product [Timema californicum]
MKVFCAALTTQPGHPHIYIKVGIYGTLEKEMISMTTVLASYPTCCRSCKPGEQQDHRRPRHDRGVTSSSPAPCSLIY